MLPPYDELATRLREHEAELAATKAENAWLRRQLFGPVKSERQDRLQVNLPLEGVAEVPVTAPVQTVSYERRAAPRGEAARPGGGVQGRGGEGDDRDRSRGGEGLSGGL